MKRQCKQIAAITLTAMIIFLVAGVAVGYLGVSDEKPNNMTVGSNSEEIRETFTPPPVQQMRNNEFIKRVTVQNTGTVPCFVRVYAEFSDSNVAAGAQVKNDTSSSSFNDWSTFKTTLATTPNAISPKWQFIPLDSSEDEKLRGYFYYKEVVPPDGETEPLFTDFKVSFTTDSSDTNIDKISAYEIIVYSETVQATEITNASGSGKVYGDGEWLEAWKSFLKIS